MGHLVAYAGFISVTPPAPACPPLEGLPVYLPLAWQAGYSHHRILVTCNSKTLMQFITILD